MTTHTCHSCPAPAAWRDQHGRCWCSSHVGTSGTFRSIRPPEPDIVDELDVMASRSDAEYAPDESKRLRKAAAEIRRLRAALAGHASGDGKHKRHGREEG